MTAVVQKLLSFQRGDIFRHLRALSAEDLRLRFGRFMNEAALTKYVDRINFFDDKVYGIYDGGLGLIGLAHLAIDSEGVFAELGVSVHPAHRRKGYGGSLLKRAVMQAANLGIHALYMHCLSENHAMRDLARKAGLRVLASHGRADAETSLKEPPGGDVTQEMVQDQTALVDYLLKQQVRWVIPKSA